MSRPVRIRHHCRNNMPTHDTSTLHKKHGPAVEQMINVLEPRNWGETAITKTTSIFG